MDIQHRNITSGDLILAKGLRMHEYEDCVNSEVWVMAMNRKLILIQRPLTFEKKKETR